MNYVSAGQEGHDAMLKELRFINDTHGPLKAEDAGDQSKWQEHARPSRLIMQIIHDFEPFWDIVCNPCRAMAGKSPLDIPPEVRGVSAVQCLAVNMAAQRVMLGIIMSALHDCETLRPGDPLLQRVREAIKTCVLTCRSYCEQESGTAKEIDRIYSSSVGWKHIRPVLIAHHLKLYMNHYEICHQRLTILLKVLENFIKYHQEDSTEKEKNLAKGEIDAFNAMNLDSLKRSGQDTNTYAKLTLARDRYTPEVFLVDVETLPAETRERIQDLRRNLGLNISVWRKHLLESPGFASKYWDAITNLDFI